MDSLKTRLRNIRLVIFDVDGVLTDDTVYIGSDDFELKRFCIADGLGIYLAKKFGIKIAFLSGRKSQATVVRANELEVEDVFHDRVNKIDIYNQLKAKYNLDDNNIAFVGNDLVDLDVMQQCGIALAVPGSPESVLKAADCVTLKTGGHGAAREVLDMILDARGIKEEDRLA